MNLDRTVVLKFSASVDDDKRIIVLILSRKCCTLTFTNVSSIRIHL